MHPATSVLSIGAVAAHSAAATALGAVTLRAVDRDTFSSIGSEAAAGAIGGAILHALAMPIHSIAHCGHPRRVPWTKTLLSATGSALWAGAMGSAVLGLAHSEKVHAPFIGTTVASLLGNVELAVGLMGIFGLAGCFGFDLLEMIIPKERESHSILGSLVGGESNSERGYETP